MYTHTINGQTDRRTDGQPGRTDKQYRSTYMYIYTTTTTNNNNNKRTTRTGQPGDLKAN